MIEGNSVNRSFKTPVTIASREYRVLGTEKITLKTGLLYLYGKIAAFFLNIPTNRGDRPPSPPDFYVFCFSRKSPDLETPI